MNTAKISIIVYLHNAQKDVEKNIRCIKQQSFSRFICYIIDDLSNYKLSSVIRSYAILDSRFQHICIDGINKADAYNYALKQVSTEYCMFVEQYDLMDIDFLKDLYELCQKYDASALLSPHSSKMQILNATQQILHILDNKNRNILYGALLKTSAIKNFIFENHKYYLDRLFLLSILDEKNIIISYSNKFLKYNNNDLHKIRNINSLDGLIAIMQNLYQYNICIQIYGLEFFVHELMHIVDVLGIKLKNEQIEAIKNAKKIIRVYIKWYLKSNRVSFHMKLKAILLCLSRRLYSSVSILHKKLKNDYEKHMDYHNAKDIRLKNIVKQKRKNK